MKNTRITLLIITIICVSLTGTVVAQNLYGPAQITAESDHTVIWDTFSAEFGQWARITLINGSNGKKASSVKIKLNGVAVVTGMDVNEGVKRHTTFARLEANNRIWIVVEGAGAGVSVRIKAQAEEDLFDRVAGVGDSLTAGMQDNTLEEPRQVWNYASQIMNQVGAEFVLPLISSPGIPPRQLDFVDGNIVLLDPQPPGQRINPDEEINNLSVPGATVYEALHVRSHPENVLFQIILGGEMTMVKKAKSLKPTFMFLSLGHNDILPMILATNPAYHTNLDDFRQEYNEVLNKLSSTGSRIVATNLVDITAVAFLVPAPAELGLPQGSRITLVDFLTLVLGGVPDLGADNILTPDELAQISATVDEFNDVIGELCAKHSIPVLDLHGLFDDLSANGREVAGHQLTTNLLGGIFSLDGVHPTNTAHAILANEFIALLNSEFGQDIEPIDVEQVFLLDPLQQNAAELLQGIASADPETVKAMKRTLEQWLPLVQR